MVGNKHTLETAVLIWFYACRIRLCHIIPLKTLQYFFNDKNFAYHDIRDIMISARGPLRGRCSLPSSFPSTHRTSDTTPLTVISRSSPTIQPSLDVCLRGMIWSTGRSSLTLSSGFSELNRLHINTSRTKEMVVDLRRKPTPIAPVNIQGLDIEVVDRCKFLGVHLNSKLDWSENIQVLYKKGQSWLHLLGQLRSFGVCRTFLQHGGGLCNLLCSCLLGRWQHGEGPETNLIDCPVWSPGLHRGGG